MMRFASAMASAICWVSWYCSADARVLCVWTVGATVTCTRLACVTELLSIGRAAGFYPRPPPRSASMR